MPVVDATVVVLARGQPDNGRVEQSQRWVRAQPPELEAGEDDALVARAAPRRLLVRVRVRVTVTVTVRVRVRVRGRGSVRVRVRIFIFPPPPAPLFARDTAARP